MRDIDQLDTLIVHHSASPLSTTLEDIRGWHLDRGWSDVGYHYVIEADGAIREGRPLGVIGAHCRKHNRRSVGVCGVGDNTRSDRSWTAEQRQSLKDLVGELRLSLPNIVVVGHRDLAATECPGMDVKDLLKEA